uniref:Uncharacterized protein n=1 Tax=Arundo donax TaxID=35708 RepID=A0A0A9B845_ARUDO
MTTLFKSTRIVLNFMQSNKYRKNNIDK